MCRCMEIEEREKERHVSCNFIEKSTFKYGKDVCVCACVCARVCVIGCVCVCKKDR